MTHDAVQGSDSSHSECLESRSTLVVVRRVVLATQCQVRNFEKCLKQSKYVEVEIGLGLDDLPLFGHSSHPLHLDTS